MKNPMEQFEKKDTKELVKILAEKRENLREFRFGMKGSRTRNTKEGSLLRKDIARIMFLLGSQQSQQTTTSK